MAKTRCSTSGSAAATYLQLSWNAGEVQVGGTEKCVENACEDRSIDELVDGDLLANCNSAEVNTAENNPIPRGDSESEVSW